MGPHIVRDRALRRPTPPDARVPMTTEESPRGRSRHFSETLQSAGEEAAGPSMPPDGTSLRAQEHALIKKPLAKKKAMCDFRVRWPEVIDQEKRKVREIFEVRSLSSVGSSTSRLDLSFTDLQSCPSEYQASQGDETATQPDLKSPYMTILESYLKSETLTRRERRMKRRTVAKLSQLEEDKEAARRRQKEQLEKSRALQEELAHQKASSKPFLELLQQKNDEFERKHDDLWNQYIQECRNIQKRRKELAVAYASQLVTLHKQLMEGRKTQASLNKKLIALKPIALIKEGQDKTIQALQEEIERLAQETLKDPEAHFKFLQEKAALEKQLEEMNRLESGEDITWELKKRARAFERAARKGHQDFCQNIRQENRQLQEDLWQMDREWRKLEATKERLEKQKQWCKEEQWYLEALTRGRRRLQEQGESSRQSPRQHSGPDTTQDSSLGAEARANPGHWLLSLRK
uniref:coiled-coil domain-containing protein 121-like n=1 Tax=Jaculus jaculus TaxID=51337 RepID=UPI001E1B22E1|nr:coiled-coil domain-containing protein 121-like [Jaculus jaculus]